MLGVRLIVVKDDTKENHTFFYSEAVIVNEIIYITKTNT